MPADTSSLLLTGGALFDSEARTFRAGLDLLCENGVITAIAAAGTLSVPARRVDCTGRFVIPGLIDCHVHLTSGGDATELNTTAAQPVPLSAWKSAEYARRTLAAGFTSVRDLGAAAQLNVHLARAIEAGVVTGPAMLAAGMGVTMTGGHGHGFLAREADGPDEVRKAVREQLRAGATTIKLFASGGVLTPGVDPRSPSFTEAELSAGVEEGHKAFRIVAAHAQATDGIKNAVRAGVDSIEHGVWLDDEAVALMASHGTYLVPTLTAPFAMLEHGAAAGLPSYMIEKSRQVSSDHIASFQRALRGGVRVAMGTDQGTPLNRPGENAQEILRMAEHGLSPAAALLAATAWAADLLRIPAGRIEVGRNADLVVLPADPLDQLNVLTNPGEFPAIVQGGQPVLLRDAARGVPTYE